MPLRAGDLRTPLVLQDPIRTSNGSGGFTTTWQSVATVWAKVLLAGGGDRDEGAQRVSRRRYQITMRRRAGMSSGMRLVRHGAQLLEILSVDTDDDHREAMLVVAEEVPGAP